MYATVSYISLDLLYIHNGDEPSENGIASSLDRSATLTVVKRKRTQKDRPSTAKYQLAGGHQRHYEMITFSIM